MYQDLIEQYEGGSAMLEAAVAGLSDEQLKSFPVPGTWSLQQLVIHLQDCDLIFADRMKRIIAQDNPTLLAFDHDGFAKYLNSDVQSAADALSLIRLQRSQLAAVLRTLPDAAFSRIGTHSERGPQTLADVLKFASSHLEHHLKFAAQKRAALQQHSPLTSSSGPV